MSTPFTGVNNVETGDLIGLHSPWANIQRNVRLSHAKMQASQELIRQSLDLMQAAASRVRLLAGDPGQRAAALGPSLARAYMRHHVLSEPPEQPEDSEVAETADGSV